MILFPLTQNQYVGDFIGLKRPETFFGKLYKKNSQVATRGVLIPNTNHVLFTPVDDRHIILTSTPINCCTQLSSHLKSYFCRVIYDQHRGVLIKSSLTDRRPLTTAVCVDKRLRSNISSHVINGSALKMVSLFRKL